MISIMSAGESILILAWPGKNRLITCLLSHNVSGFDQHIISKQMPFVIIYTLKIINIANEEISACLSIKFFLIKLTAFFLLFSPVNESYSASYFNISSLFNCSVNIPS